VSGILVFTVAMVIAGIGAERRWLPMFILGAALAGAGSGYIRATVANAVTRAAGDENLGIAGGSLNMLQQIGAALGITVLTALMGDSISGDRFLALHLVAAGMGLIAAGLASRIGREGESEGESESELPAPSPEQRDPPQP
jgi:MFS family permease